MNWRLMYVMLVLAAVAGAGVGAAGEGDEDDVPALDADEDDEIMLHREESRNVHPRAYQQGGGAGGGGGAQYNALGAGGGFRPGAAASLAELAGYTRPQQHQPQPQPQHTTHQKIEQDRRGTRFQETAAGVERERGQAEREEEEEREEPDRLAGLLQQSRFQCAGKQSGYYADTELHCEVFHYCQDNVKHSWICPDGFTFHQVHLICMPPTQENICEKSAKYHFVNEYLYRPVNEEEVQRKPSTALRYSERYYPSEVYHDDRYEDDDDDPQVVAPTRAAPPASPAAPAQVFRSAEEVNIPLGQRRPHHPYDFRF